MAISGDPVFTPCKHCGTKVDPVTGRCNRAATGNCTTVADEASRVFATVDLADWSGQVRQVLIGGAELALLSGLKSEADVAAMIEVKGAQSLCLKGPCDMRLATAPHLIQARPLAPSQGFLSQPRDAEATTQFQVLAARPSLGVPYDKDARPMVTQVLRLEKERADDAILHIQDIYKDVCCSDLGTFFPMGSLFASYVTLIVTAKDEPEVQQLVVGEDKFLMTCHREAVVFPTGSDARSFSTEAYCQWKNCYLFNMADGAPRLVLGRVLENASTGHRTSHIEWMHRLTETDVEAQILERGLIWKTLKPESNVSSSKRAATDLIASTSRALAIHQIPPKMKRLRIYRPNPYSQPHKFIRLRIRILWKIRKFL